MNCAPAHATGSDPVVLDGKPVLKAISDRYLGNAPSVPAWPLQMSVSTAYST
jgi:hypothetical protein